MKINKKQSRQRRHARIRSKISGTSTIPRISVFRSNAHVFVQVIDDLKGITIASMSDKLIKKGTKTEKATEVGTELAKKVLGLGIKRAVFDKGGYKYHGRISAVANAMRVAGLTI